MELYMIHTIISLSIIVLSSSVFALLPLNSSIKIKGDITQLQEDFMFIMIDLLYLIQLEDEQVTKAQFLLICKRHYLDNGQIVKLREAIIDIGYGLKLKGKNKQWVPLAITGST